MRKSRSIVGVIFIILALVILFGFDVSQGFKRARQKAESINCANAVVSVTFGIRQWIDDNGGEFPKDFVCLSNELNTTRILVCPVDHTRVPVLSWSDFSPTNSSYELLQPGSPRTNSDTAVLRCRLHGHVGYLDGTVFDGVRRRHKYD